jgi:YD repeat-containing protein
MPFYRFIFVFFILGLFVTPIHISTSMQSHRPRRPVLTPQRPPSRSAPVRVQDTDACPDIPVNGGESMSATIRVAATGSPVAHQALIPARTQLRLDALATAFGSCGIMALNCAPLPCQCQLMEVQPRTVNHINITADISTATALNGSYVIGYVFGRNPDGTTGFFNVLDTQAGNSTGPIYYTPPYPGTYQFHFQATINVTSCPVPPTVTPEVTLTVYVRDTDDDENNGPTDCNANVGEPINVTNGNMYVQHPDYRLPGLDGGLPLIRTYNSQSGRTGLFGFGWTSTYEESINAYGASLLRLNLADGRAVYFTASGGGAFTPKEPLNVHGQIVKNADGSYTLTLTDGMVHEFDAAGKLLSITDRNNNQTRLTYDASGKLVTVTDPVGRSLTLNYGANGKVSSISDSLGTIATYTYDAIKRLLTVTYADSSKFSYTYDGSSHLTTVKDALNNVLESHTYDALGRALKSERQGGVNRVTLTYVSATETDATDALGHVTK